MSEERQREGGRKILGESMERRKEEREKRRKEGRIKEDWPGPCYEYKNRMR